jgi:hypothetical protein
MSLDLLDSILLRTLTDPIYDAKGSELTWGELDTNQKILGDAIRELSAVEVSGIDPYNAGTEYSNADPDYVTYDNNTWEYVNAIPSTGVTPGTDPSTWALASQGLFSHQQNTDSSLALGTVNEVTASEIRTFIDSYSAYDDTLVFLIDGSKDMEADINFANDGTGITWVGGSSIKEASGILSIISYDELRLNSGAASVFIDGADIVIDDLFGLVWDGGNVYIKKDNTDLLIQNSLALGNIFIDSGTGGEIALGGDLIRLASTNVRFSNLTASTVVYLDASKNLVSSAITPTQLGYLSPATGNTGTGSLVFGTSPAITTSLTTGSTTFALVNTTATTVNFAGGASVALNIGNASGTNTISGATTFSQALIGSTSLTIASDTDATTILGRCRVHSNVSDRMLISHFDLSSSTNFVIEQLSTGASKFNAGSGQSASISVNRTDKVMVSATETKIVSGNNFWLGNAAVTGLSAGALAATTNASIVIYDSAGQAYRIPCII